MWNFVSFPAPLPMLFSHEKNVALQKYIFAPGKTEGNFPLRKTGNQLRNRRLPPFLLWTLRSLFSGETTSFSRIIFGVQDPKPTPKQSAAHKKSQLRSRKNPKIQETYASKLKQMKAMHSELQTYQSQASLFVSRTVNSLSWETWVFSGGGGFW